MSCTTAVIEIDFLFLRGLVKTYNCFASSEAKIFKTKLFDMNFNFTRIGLLMTLVFAIGSVQAQTVNALRIDSPAEVAGEYRIILAQDWGQQLSSELAGTGTFVNDGEGTTTDACDGTIENITGKIAFIDRGSCEFGLKALNAENAGAIAVVICNNVDDGTAPGLGAGAVGDQVSIPVAGMTFQDCQTIRTVAETMDVEAVFTFADCLTPTYGPDVVWGNVPGQGDFEDGLNDWIVACQGDTCWGWSSDETVLQNGSFATGVGIAVPTICNGSMVFDSDRHDNLGGGAGAIGTGECVAPCEGSLISPTIDLTQYDLDGLFVEFDQQTRQFQSTYQLILSKNGGVTWPDTINLNTDLQVNSPHVANTQRIPAEGYQDAQSITMQFRYVGNYYYWVIDDVRLVNEATADMNLRTDFFAVAPTYRTPVNQAAPMPFLIDIDNLGNIPAEDVAVTVEIFNELGETVFESTNTNYAVQPPGEFLNENSVFPETFTPTEVGPYQGRYMISTSSGDNNPDNDAVDFFFEVTENILSPLPPEEDFANPLAGIFSGARFIDPTDQFFVSNYATGYIFYLPNGDNHTLSNVRFGIHELPVETQATVDVYLYQWLYRDEDNSGNFVVSPDDTELIGVNTQQILTFGGAVRVGTSQVPDIRKIDIPMGQAGPDGFPLLDNNNNPVPIDLANNRNYVMVIACRSGDGLPLNLIGTNPTANIQTRSFLHGATNLAYDSLGLDIVVGGFLEDITSDTGPTQMLDFEIDSQLTGAGGTGNFGVLYDFRVLLAEMTIVEKTSSTEDLNLVQNIDVYPNPVSDFVFVDLKLDEMSERVNVELVNARGQRVLSQNFNNVFKQRLEVNVSDISNGIYMMNVRTDAGLSAKKLVIQH